jgi:hypothetical protein
MSIFAVIVMAAVIGLPIFEEWAKGQMSQIGGRGNASANARKANEMMTNVRMWES